MSGASQESILENFISITGADITTANSFLAGTGHDLERAIDNFFNNPSAADVPTDEELARQLASEGAREPAKDSASVPGQWNGLDEEVRAPLPTKTDRLYGDDPFLAEQLRAYARRGAPQEVNAFRNSDVERLRGSQLDKGLPRTSLGDMFQPPLNLMFQGNFDMAKSAAHAANKWLLVNIQSNTEFASHQLNRDTWGDANFQDVVKVAFVFLQCQNTSAEGEKVISFYKLCELPSILVVDPVTGVAMRSLSGFCSPERLMEELVAFLDCGPKDPDARKLSSARMKKRKQKQLTEQEELEAAIAMSMQQEAAVAEEPDGTADPQKPSTSGLGTSPTEATGTTNAPLNPIKDAKEIQKEAAAKLPLEADIPPGESCKVGIRLPDGTRLVRVFPKSGLLELLRLYCIASSLEAAEGRDFQLLQAQTRPGGGSPVLTDLSQTLEEAGVANTLVTISWL